MPGHSQTRTRRAYKALVLLWRLVFERLSLTSVKRLQALGYVRDNFANSAQMMAFASKMNSQTILVLEINLTPIRLKRDVLICNFAVYEKSVLITGADEAFRPEMYIVRELVFRTDIKLVFAYRAFFVCAAI